MKSNHAVSVAKSNHAVSVAKSNHAVSVALVVGLTCMVTTPAMSQVAEKASSAGSVAGSVFAKDAVMQAVFAEATGAGAGAGARAGSWDRIQQFDQTDRKVLIQQLALFTSAAKTTSKSMLAGVVIKKYAMSESDLVDALVPMLGVDDAELHRKVQGMLAALEGKSATRSADFSIYREILEDSIRAQGDAPAALVKHMYEVDPGAGLLTMMRSTGMREPEKLREILWAEHTVSNATWKQTHGFLGRTEVEPEAIAQLQRMAAHPQWWARAYVPAIMRKHKSFRSNDLLEQLTSDRDPRVAKFAASVRDSAE